MNKAGIVPIVFGTFFHVGVNCQGVTDAQKSGIRQVVSAITPDSAFQRARNIVENNFEDKKEMYVALEVLTIIEPQIKKSAEYYSLRAKCNERIGNLQEALNLFSKAISIDPNEAYLYIDRASCKVLIGNTYAAIVDLTKALTFKPNNQDILVARANCYIGTKQWNLALADINAAYPTKNSGKYLLYRGLIRVQSGRKQEGCVDLNAATELGENEALGPIKKYCGS